MKIKILLLFFTLLLLNSLVSSIQAQVSKDDSKVIIFTKPFENKNNPSDDIRRAISSAFQSGLISSTKTNTSLQVKSDNQQDIYLNQLNIDIEITGNISLVKDGLITVIINADDTGGSKVSTFSENIPLSDYENPTMRKNFFRDLGKKLVEEGSFNVFASRILSDRITVKNNSVSEKKTGVISNTNKQIPLEEVITTEAIPILDKKFQTQVLIYKFAVQDAITTINNHSLDTSKLKRAIDKIEESIIKIDSIYNASPSYVQNIYKKYNIHTLRKTLDIKKAWLLVNYYLMVDDILEIQMHDALSFIKKKEFKDFEWKSLKEQSINSINGRLNVWNQMISLYQNRRSIDKQKQISDKEKISEFLSIIKILESIKKLINQLKL
ncbi:hypothetical protein WAF17_16475 [Bernardetia sp. ABR2-2B]|uniref:hypothetical protein n=1 Tax=Bernardetia sp. ABR2-2B TaxID=3127472 RepID=UPI0030CA9D73